MLIKIIVIILDDNINNQE